MTYYDIYLSALALIGEAEDSAGAIDYKKRTVVLLPHIVSSLCYANQLLCNSSPDAKNLFNITLDSDFPLDLRLCTAVSTQLASLLVIDELPEMSQKLAQHAATETKHVLAGVTVIGSTREVY